MERQSKYSTRLKINSIEIYLSGDKSAAQLAQENNINKATIYSRVNKYMAQGEEVLKIKKRYSTYAKVFKKEVVDDYRKGLNSLQSICSKYSISSVEWIGYTKLDR